MLHLAQGIIKSISRPHLLIEGDIEIHYGGLILGFIIFSLSQLIRPGPRSLSKTMIFVHLKMGWIGMKIKNR